MPSTDPEKTTAIQDPPVRNRRHDDVSSGRPSSYARALQSAIFHSAIFSKIGTDGSGVIQVFNDGAERMLGYTSAEVVDKLSLISLCDPQEQIDHASSLTAEMSSTVESGFGALVFKASRGIEDIHELTYLRKDGARVPAIVSVTALRDGDGGHIGYLLTSTDNTARKRVEDEQRQLDQLLRDQQFYTRSLIESNIDALMTTNPQGVITDVNKQMESLTGAHRDELVGAPFKDFFTDPGRAEEGIRRVLSENKVTDYELTARSRDGRETVVSYNATTFHDRHGQLQGVFAAARDVTERRLLDLALRQTNAALEGAKSAAEKANLAKSDFLSGMSHELRSPLNAILGFAQLMESGFPLPTPSQKESIDQILQAGWYLLELINEILDLSLIESGKLSLSSEPMSLTEVLEDCHSMIEPQARSSGIRLTFAAAEHELFVHADRTRVKQVLLNLLSNAIKYNRPDGAVEVFCEASATGRIRVSFRDTGLGLSVEEIAQLFQPFNRLGQEAGPKEGTGIGLVFSKRLVELMGGSIGVESEVGIGSVFWIELNAAIPQQLEPEILNDPRHHSRLVTQPATRHLLYVEDNTANMRLVERLVERRSDIRLLGAKTGLRGVEIARESKPDVILMDINLPGLNGFDAMRILAADARTSAIPVIAISANAMPHDVTRGLQAGFFRYLTKPIKVQEFMDTLDAALKFLREREGLSSNETVNETDL
jgi:PAS domain S-box-containing protein